MSTSAPIYSTTGEGRAHADSAAWARFSSTADSNEFCQAWLTILCGQLERVSGALLLLRGEQEGSYAAAVVWPHAGSDMRHLGPAAQRALTERRGLVMAPDGSSPPGRDQPAYVAYPVEVGDTLYGAVVLDLPPGAEPALQQALRTVHWGIAWLIDQFRRQVLAERDARLADLALGTDLIATTLQERRFAPSALAAVNALAGHLECERVSLGMERAGCIDVLAISHTANFDRKSNLVRLIGEAMEEVLDLDVAVVYPVPEDDELGAPRRADSMSGRSRCARPSGCCWARSWRSSGRTSGPRGSACVMAPGPGRAPCLARVTPASNSSPCWLWHWWSSSAWRQANTGSRRRP
jgi:hypothetical protein